MPVGYCFVDPTNPANKIWTISMTDPAIPAGWINSGGVDGATDRDVQTFKAGAASGGFPRYPQNTGNPIETDLRNLDGTGAIL